MAPNPETLIAFLALARAKAGQAQILAGMAEFAALAGNRRVEFLELHWTQVSDAEIRLIRGKQRDGKQIVEVVSIKPRHDRSAGPHAGIGYKREIGAVFHNRAGNPYTESGFKAMWSKLVAQALKNYVIAKRFTFHDLRAYYVTQHKIQRVTLPDLHANPGTTARIYDRSTDVKRNSL